MTDRAFRGLAYAGLVIVCLLLYGGTLSYPFLFDDYIYLLENPLVVDERSFGFYKDFQNFATASYRLGLDPDLSVNFILRPVTYLTFHLNHAWDGWNPRGFRAFNIVVHGINALLIFELLLLLVGMSKREIADRAKSARFIAVFGALLFLVHPLAIESVTYIVQRFTSLATMFYIFVLFAYFRSAREENVVAARVWYWLSVVALVIGTLSKEFLFTAPFLIIVIDYVVMGRSLKTSCRWLIPHFLTLPIIPALMVATSWALKRGGFGMESAMFVAAPLQGADYQLHYALTELAVVVTYLRMIVAPYGLNLDPDFPILRSMGDFRVLGSFLFIAALVVGTGYWFWRAKESLHRALIFSGVLWFFLAISIDSSIVPLPDVMAEHRSYFPSIGAMLAIIAAADYLRTKWNSREHLRYVVPTVTALWLIALAGATVLRHQVWSTEVAMWRDVTKKSPNKTRAWINLGVSNFRAKRNARACKAFEEAIRLSPKQIIAYINLASTQLEMGDRKKALATASSAVRLSPSQYDTQLYFLLGKIWLESGRVKKSIKCAEKVVEINPNHRDGHRVLMTLYAKTEQYEKALKHSRIIAALTPDDEGAKRDVQTLEAQVAQVAQR